jgi:hypothetical protein
LVSDRCTFRHDRRDWHGRERIEAVLIDEECTKSPSSGLCSNVHKRR